VMERRMLLGLRERAEGRAAAGPLDVLAGAGFAAAVATVVLLFLRRRRGRGWLALPMLLLTAVVGGTGDVLASGARASPCPAGAAGFIALGLVLLALPHRRARWPVLLPVPAGVLLVLLLAPDAFLAFGLTFAAVGLAWLAVRRPPIAGALRRVTAMPLLVALPVLFAPPTPAWAQAPVVAPGRALAEALARYDTLAAGPDLRPLASRRVVRRGDVHPDAATLRR
jgi:hypothetical protein